MDRPQYRFKITELHGMIKDKFYLINKNDRSLCCLDCHPASNTHLPIVFETEEEAKHFLETVPEEEAADALIVDVGIHFFDVGCVLYKETTEDGEGVYMFSYGED